MSKMFPDYGLHNKMIEICKNNFNNKNTLTDSDLRHIPKKDRRQLNGRWLLPDLALDDTAVECLSLNKGILKKLDGYGKLYGHLIFCIPVPKLVEQVWFYDPNKEHVYRKFFNTKDGRPKK